MRVHDTPAILVIDDDQDLARALTTRLNSLGFRCVAASSGADGFVKFQGERFDLIVSDLNMPGGNGVALAERIRQISDVPIIFVTGCPEEFKVRLQHAQHMTTLKKPFDSQHLIDLISATLAANTTAASLSC